MRCPNCHLENFGEEALNNSLIFLENQTIDLVFVCPNVECDKTFEGTIDFDFDKLLMRDSK